MRDIVKAVGNCSYNQLVEKIISCKQSDNSELAGEGEHTHSPPVSSLLSFHTSAPEWLGLFNDTAQICWTEEEELKPGPTRGADIP